MYITIKLHINLTGLPIVSFSLILEADGQGRTGQAGNWALPDALFETYGYHGPSTPNLCAFAPQIVKCT